MTFHIVLVQSSLRKDSRTAVVMDHVAKAMGEYDNVRYTLLDLRDFNLPFCDARSREDYYAEYPDVKKIYDIMSSADAFIFGYPNYVYTFSGVFKNFIDLFGGTTSGKYYGIVVNAGGRNGYMSSNDLISIMLYDFSATAIMPQVYTARGDFGQAEDGSWLLTAPKPLQKIQQTVEALVTKLVERRPIERLEEI